MKILMKEGFFLERLFSFNMDQNGIELRIRINKINEFIPNIFSEISDEKTLTTFVCSATDFQSHCYISIIVNFR